MDNFEPEIVKCLIEFMYTGNYGKQEFTQGATGDKSFDSSGTEDGTI
jgi:hypothetical protein